MYNDNRNIKNINIFNNNLTVTKDIECQINCLIKNDSNKTNVYEILPNELKKDIEFIINKYKQLKIEE